MKRTNPHRKAIGRLLVPKLVERYGFLKYPKTLDEFSSGELEFGSGAWNGYAVDQLRLMPQGLLVATGESTDTAEALAQEVLTLWPEIGLTFSPDFVTNSAYGSHLVISSEVDLGNLNRDVDTLVRESLRGAFGLPGEAGMYGVSFYTNGNTDDAQVRIERVAGVALDQNQYWCQAPMSTKAHLEFLRRFEEILIAGAASGLARQP